MIWNARTRWVDVNTVEEDEEDENGITVAVVDDDDGNVEEEAEDMEDGARDVGEGD
jgi:hypothetical protein